MLDILCIFSVLGEDGQVPDIIMQAVNFIAGFRSSNFGSMILDNDLLD